ncbi:hypothetical protein KP509_14G079400 [Ceratopteris richardii]|uniref:Uncharacterized protein n=1 Tax=Ceratopteris richardii TaxID=49495 RepID=A0A8T2TBQ3_CERRI|nr:hypothetical protein KP509_14G079400 [Ceratopteris richardii]
MEKCASEGVEQAIAVGSRGSLLSLLVKEVGVLQASRRSWSVSSNGDLACKIKSTDPLPQVAGSSVNGGCSPAPSQGQHRHHIGIVSSLWNELKGLLRSPTSQHHGSSAASVHLRQMSADDDHAGELTALFQKGDSDFSSESCEIDPCPSRQSGTLVMSTRWSSTVEQHCSPSAEIRGGYSSAKAVTDAVPSCIRKGKMSLDAVSWPKQLSSTKAATACSNNGDLPRDGKFSSSYGSAKKDMFNPSTKERLCSYTPMSKRRGQELQTFKPLDDHNDGELAEGRLLQQSCGLINRPLKLSNACIVEFDGPESPFTPATTPTTQRFPTSSSASVVGSLSHSYSMIASPHGEPFIDKIVCRSSSSLTRPVSVVNLQCCNLYSSPSHHHRHHHHRPNLLQHHLTRQVCSTSTRRLSFTKLRDIK